MRSHHLIKGGIGLVASLAALLALALPASATVYNYDVELIRGRITVGSTNFDTPGTTPATCIGSTAISGQIDDGVSTNNITGNLDIESSDFAAPFTSGRFQLIATGAATGANAGDYNATTETFTDLVFPTINFTIKSVNTSTCVVGATVCSGTATLTVGGRLLAPASLPLVTGDDVEINSTAGEILTTASCGFPWGFVVAPGEPLSIGANPAFPADQGAIFEQV